MQQHYKTQYKLATQEPEHPLLVTQNKTIDNRKKTTVN